MRENYELEKVREAIILFPNKEENYGNLKCYGLALYSWYDFIIYSTKLW